MEKKRLADAAAAEKKRLADEAAKEKARQAQATKQAEAARRGKPDLSSNRMRPYPAKR